MPNLEQQTTYDVGVYQIETDDVVIGGPEGIANKSSINLGNRTAWIKKQIDNTVLAAGMTVDDTKLTSLSEAIAAIASENSSELSSALNSNSTTVGATSNAVKLLNDVLNLLAQTVADKAPADHSHTLPSASTAQSGITQLNNSIDSNNQTEAATPYALKTLKDLLTQLINDNTPSQIIGGIGTYALLSSPISVYEGNSYAGSSLKYAGASGNAANTLMNYAGANVTGTWLCMGNSVQRQAGWQQHTLFLRIA